MNGLILCTKQCNLRCKYCFEDSMHKDCTLGLSEIRDMYRVFQDTCLEKFVSQLAQINRQMGKHASITFHGGEPLMIGAELLEESCEIIRHFQEFEICMQTNATLVTPEIARVMRKYGIKVGVSLDGPKEMNDAYRVSVGANGTYDTIIRNIQLMQDAGVTVGALATVTDVTLEDPIGFYNFFKEHNLSFSFNPCFIEPNSTTGQKGLDIDDYIDFYKKMFDIFIEDNASNLNISCFERILSAMSVKKKVFMEVCSFIPDCSMTTVAINPAGDFYRCLHYCMDDKNKIGNILHDPLSLAVGNMDFSERWSTMKETVCAECDIQDFCCGGCPYVAESQNGTIISKADTCRSQKAIVHYIHDYLLQFCRKE